MKRGQPLIAGVSVLVAVATVPLTPLVAATGYQESPALTARVLQHELPALETRLPARPLILQPGTGGGQYGGVWRLATVETNDPGFLYRNIGYEPLVRWDPQWRRVVPGVAERWEISADATRYAFFLRPGLRWSDGVLFSEADILFWRNEVAGRTNSLAGQSSWLAPGGVLPAVSSPNPGEVVFEFSRPNLMFLQWLATPDGSGPVSHPRHALARCFPNLNPNAVADARAQGMPSPWSWYRALSVSPYRSLGPVERIPTLNAWQVATAGSESGRFEAVARRNPYYWKIDPAGRQLPYLDEVRVVTVGTVSNLLALATAGELHMQDHYLGARDQLAALQQAAVAGKIKLNRRVPSHSNLAAISLNLVHRDPELRNFFGNREVRIALSKAINREHLIREELRINTEPYQVAPRPESAFYSERLGRQHLDFDPVDARRRMIAAGYTIDGEQQLRARNGRPIHFTIHIAGGVTGDAAIVAAAVARDWAALGLRVRVESVNQGEFYELKRRNQHDAVIWSGDGGFDPLLEPRYYVPVSSESNYAIPWARWYQKARDAGAEEPPNAIRALFKQYDDLLAAPDEAAQRARWNRLAEMSADELLVIGIALPPVGIGVVHPSFRNVPDSIFASWNYPQPGPANPCQFSLAE